MYDASTTISDFLSAAAARKPTPGGGSVAALAGALAASMGEMVVNYSIGRKGLEAHQGDLQSALAQLTKARGILIELMIEDQLAYEAVTAARKLPPDVADRAARCDAALLACIRVPETMAATALRAIELCGKLVDIVNPWLLSDLAVCAEMAMATVRCALHNVRTNLADVTDPADRASMLKTIADLSARARAQIMNVVPRIVAREEASRRPNA